MRPIDADAFEEFIRNKCTDSLVDLWCELVRRQPTIDLPGKWIPCSERNPEFEIYSVKKLWVTMHRKGWDFRFVRQLRWNGYQGVWEWENGKTISDEWEIIAWKPVYIPEPYKDE